MSLHRLGALCALVLVIAACSAGPGAGGQLEGTQWVLSSVWQDGALTVLPDTAYADAEFDAHKVEGFSGCNTYDAVYRAGGRTLLVTQPRATLTACDPDSMAFEQAYLAALNASRFYTSRTDTLTVYDSGGNAILVYDAAPRNPLLGKWIVDSYGVPPSTVNAVAKDTQLDIAFGIGSVGGHSGCNSFSGTYGTNGNVVRVSQLATTRLACEQPVMDQETAFLAALQGVARIDSRGSQLNLEDRDGHLLVALVRPQPPAADASASPVVTPPASATPKPTTAATATPTASPKPTATPSPTASPTPKPTTAPTASPKPTAKPTAAPTATPTIAPSAPPSFPPTGQCDLLPLGGGATAAKLVYPGSWFTVTEPPELACRYFDAAEITVPADPATLDTAVRADIDATAFADAVAKASDPATWTVKTSSSFDAGGTAVTCISATAAADSAGIPVGEARYACFADVKSAGTVTIWAHGAPDETFVAESGVVTLMTFLSTFTAPA